MVQRETLTNYRKAREVAFRILFMLDQSGQTVTQALTQSEELRELPPNLAAYARKVVRGAYRQRNALDALYAPHLSGWRLERLAPVDRAITRLCLYEITQNLVPVAVAIDEAVELAKIYGSEDSPKFVNGLLGATVRALNLSDSAQVGSDSPDASGKEPNVR